MVKQALSDVEKVKRKSYGDVSEIAKIRQEIAKYLKNKKAKSILGKKIMDEIERIENISVDSLGELEIYALSNRITFLEKITSLEKSWKEFDIKSLASKSEMQLALEDVECLKNYLKNDYSLWINFSEQQLEDVQGELERITFWVSIVQIKEKFKKAGNTTYDAKINSVVALVTNGKRLEGREKAAVETSLQYLKEKVPGLCITENERVQIIRAMGLSKGHWYKCPKGKIFY